jgi:uncharacterized protein YkwD
MLATMGVTTAAAPAAAPPACANAHRVPTRSSTAATRAALLCLVNAARTERQVPALRPEAHLRHAAERFARALDPARPLTHAGRGGSSPLERIAAAGYRGATDELDVSETLGRSIGTTAAPAERVRAWLADPPTRRLLLARRFRDAGIGVVIAGGKTTFVVELAVPR